MESLYNILRISRQAVHKKEIKQRFVKDKQPHLISEIRKLRQQHPRLSARKVYRILKPGWMGRDKFESFCFSNGLKLYRKRSYHRTTDSRGVTRFDNLIGSRELTGINQVWVSDITYYRIGERFYYLTLIMDQFSRSIVGYSASKSMHAEQTTVSALSDAIKNREPAQGLIFHSDGGGQYYCNEFKRLTRRSKFLNSMGKCAYENPHAERINGTIKNDYLIYYNPTNFVELRAMLKKAVDNYNNQRPHSSLNELSPKQFEAVSHKKNFKQ
jgi:putative transposase